MKNNREKECKKNAQLIKYFYNVNKSAKHYRNAQESSKYKYLWSAFPDFSTQDPKTQSYDVPQ